MTEGARILVVDDERQIRRMLNTLLTAHDYVVQEASGGQAALKAAAEFHPDIILLDLGLPDMEGVTVIRRLREWMQIPIIILSVRESEQEKVAALDAGADDYLTKPFSMGELLARIRVSLRHFSQNSDEPIFRLDQLTIDFSRRQVLVKGEEISLTPIEYDLLRILVQHGGRVLTHRQLLRTVWGETYEHETHLLRVNISNLRHKIEEDPTQPKLIVTEAGIGYRLNLSKLDQWSNA
jgi:two-component system KDP operon response regulator KdpE